ncbi:hypothetical protein CASFOL_033671 [Castilleja foliolosa]|uniref:Transmembrane protein n=1 Tax=Castilleja foliolosa TaxID=1961234 RepID=A0ABD3BXL5_9LAMI
MVLAEANLAPSSKRGLQLHTNRGYTKRLMDEQFNSVECNNEGGNNEKELYFDSETSWIGAEGNNTPWWRTADTDELASFVAQRSLEHIENCDLPRPQKSSAQGHLVSSANKSLRYIDSAHELLPDMHSPDNNNMTNAQLMEALRHSQTRAREAEKAANQAHADKEHVVKFVFRQASHLFAYKQWLQLLQLENVYLQFVNNKCRSVSIVFPVISPQERHKSWHKGSGRKKRDKHCCSQYDVGKYNVVFALGLGLAGAGFLLGWTIGWILPTW